MRLLLSSLLVLALLPLAADPAFGRKLEDWPYARLFKEADLVIIAAAEGTTETNESYNPQIWKTRLLGQETTFKVQSTLKGQVNHGQLKQGQVKEGQLKLDQPITVLHFKLREGVLLQDGPLLVSFRKDSLTFAGTIRGNKVAAELEKPEYLLFLRLREDGRYEPVSGHIDPVLSTRELHRADGFLSTLGGK